MDYRNAVLKIFFVKKMPKNVFGGTSGTPIYYS